MESIESKHNGGFEGIESEKKVKANNKNSMSCCESLLRVLAIVLTLSSATILGLNNQNAIVSLQVVDTLPPISLPVSAKWHYLSAFMYLVIANALASAYAAISLIFTLVKRGGKSTISGLHFVTLDAVMMGLLFSSNGAAFAIGLMGFEGNSHVQWKKVCDVFDKFCDQTIAALVVSLVGAIVFLALVILAAKRLHNK